MYTLLSFIFCILLILNHNNNVNGQEQQNDDCCEEYCYTADRDKPQSYHYSTKTVYKKVGNFIPDLASILPNDCKDTKVWILSRHGTRLPDTKFINSMGELSGIRNETERNYNQGNVRYKGRLCTPDLIYIKSWRINSSITVNKANELTSQGSEELKLLAKNYQRIFHNVLSDQYDSKKFRFHSTNTNRTKDSLMAFATGLFSPNITNDRSFRNFILNDSFLRPQEACPAYKEQNQADKDDPESEIRKFEASDLYYKTVSHISKRLGFSQVLPNDKIELIWDMCRYEEAWHSSRSNTWCAAFTLSQNDVLEYQQDLKYYYKSGYGHESNTKMACYAIQDMLKHLSSDDQPQSITHFSHSALIQLFLVALGAFKDNEPLKADNMDKMRNREWQTSSISPFAANIVAAKYKCSTSSPNEPKILFLINGKPLEISGCKNGLCDLSYLQTKYEHFINANCQEYYCSSSGRTNSKFAFIISISFLVIYKLIYSII